MMPFVAPAWLIVFPLLVLLVHFSLNSIKSSHKCGLGCQCRISFQSNSQIVFHSRFVQGPVNRTQMTFPPNFDIFWSCSVGIYQFEHFKGKLKGDLFETLLRFSCFRSDTCTLQQQQHAVAKKKKPTWKLSGGTTREKNSNLEEEENCLGNLLQKRVRDFLFAARHHTRESTLLYGGWGGIVVLMYLLSQDREVKENGQWWERWLVGQCVPLQWGSWSLGEEMRRI